MCVGSYCLTPTAYSICRRLELCVCACRKCVKRIMWMGDGKLGEESVNGRALLATSRGNHKLIH